MVLHESTAMLPNASVPSAEKWRLRKSKNKTAKEAADGSIDQRSAVFSLSTVCQAVHLALIISAMRLLGLPLRCHSLHASLLREQSREAQRERERKRKK